MAGALEIFGVSMGMLLSGTASAVGQKVVYQHNVTSECPGALAPQYTTFAKVRPLVLFFQSRGLHHGENSVLCFRGCSLGHRWRLP